MSGRQVFRGRIVTASAVIDGAIEVDDGIITRVDGAHCHDGGADVDSPYWVPGAVDLHSDSFEQHLNPRPGVSWPVDLALEAHDRDCAAAGITTVFDGLRLGELVASSRQRHSAEHLATQTDQLEALGLLRIEHRFNLRCELLAEGVVDLARQMVGHPKAGIICLMDHSPDTGVPSRRSAFEARRRKEGWRDVDINKNIEMLADRRKQIGEAVLKDLLAMSWSNSRLSRASHDDATRQDVLLNWQRGVSIAEFPVSLDAARIAIQQGMSVVMGAPNLVRGGSHTGNVSVAELLVAGMRPALASDYAPVSLIASAFMAHAWGMLSLPDAVSLVSRVPAAIAGLQEVGEIAQGRFADLACVRTGPEGARVVCTFKRGMRVA